MAVARKLLRAAVVRLLKDASTGAGDNVFPSRVRSLWPGEELPCLCVYTLNDPATVLEVSPPRYKRSVDLAVECIVKMDEGWDDATDDLADAVERVLIANSELTAGGVFFSLTLSGVELVQRGEGDSIHVSAAVRATVLYEFDGTLTDDEAAALDDFVVADVRYDIGGDQHPDDQAEDVISLPVV